MVIDKMRMDEKSVVILKGDTGGNCVLDENSSPEFVHVISSELGFSGIVELDFAEVTYVSSVGLSAILTAWKSTRKENVELLIINVSDNVMEVLDKVGFADYMNIV